MKRIAKLILKWVVAGVFLGGLVAIVAASNTITLTMRTPIINRLDQNDRELRFRLEGVYRRFDAVDKSLKAIAGRKIGDYERN